MIKGVIFNNIYEARAFNKTKSFEISGFTGNSTKYKFRMIKLEKTTTLTKEQYAQYENISSTIITDEGETPNPQYIELQNFYTVNKYAVIVNDDLIVNTYDEETGELISSIEPPYVEEIEPPIIPNEE